MPLGEPHDADRRLVEALGRGESDALVELMRRYGAWVRGVIFAACGDADAAEDVQQQVWLSAWRRASCLAEPAKWRGWLYALAYHAAVDAARKATRRRRLMRRVLAWLPPRAAVPDEAPRRVILDEDHRRALRAVRELPDIYRGPFVLRHLAGWTYRQIAEAMDLPAETVETRLVRARRLLRDKLARGTEES